MSNWFIRDCIWVKLMYLTTVLKSMDVRHFLVINFSVLKTSFEGTHKVFVEFVEDNATMSSIRYFEYYISYFVQNRRK